VNGRITTKRSFRVRGRVALANFAATLFFLSQIACQKPTEPTPPGIRLTGEWLLGVRTTASTCASDPSFTSFAPRSPSLGTATLALSGERLVGDLYIGGVPSGTLTGTLDGDVLTVALHLEGENRGTLTEAEKPCRVVGSGAGKVNTNCYVAVPMRGSFACPSACADTGMVLTLDRTAPHQRCQFDP